VELQRHQGSWDVGQRIGDAESPYDEFRQHGAKTAEFLKERSWQAQRHDVGGRKGDIDIVCPGDRQLLNLAPNDGKHLVDHVKDLSRRARFPEVHL
jgi:hypothetical protein